jgi:hypothetical protein
MENSLEERRRVFAWVRAADRAAVSLIRDLRERFRRTSLT